MTGEGEEQEKNKLGKEKIRVSEGRKLTEERKGASDRLFVLEIDLSLDESSDEPRVYALELLSAKLKRQICSKNHLCLPFESNCTNFPAHKGKEISTVRSPSRR